MKIYTKKGDAGKTSLYGGERVDKDHLRLGVYGTLDELNASLGIALSDSHLSHDLKKKLLRIQNDLFQLGSELATPSGKNISITLISENEIRLLEKEIDEMEERLAPLKNFILPGGSQSSARLHFSRTVCRRAERELITFHKQEPSREEVLKYLNRLSDYLFVCARFANFESGQEDVPWEKK